MSSLDRTGPSEGSGRFRGWNLYSPGTVDR